MRISGTMHKRVKQPQRLLLISLITNYVLASRLIAMRLAFTAPRFIITGADN